MARLQWLEWGTSGTVTGQGAETRSRSLIQERIKLALGFERVQIVAATHVGLANENLRDRHLTRQRDHFIPGAIDFFDVDFRNRDVLLVEQTLGADAVRAPGRRVHLYVRHGSFDELLDLAVVRWALFIELGPIPWFPSRNRHFR
jgi:hypothetical protein